MPDTDDKNADKPLEPSSRPIKNRLSKFEGIIVSRERTFDILSTIITAVFTVVLAISTALLWNETAELRKFAKKQSEDMDRSIEQAAIAGKAMVRSADAMVDVAKTLAANAEATKEANAAQWRAYLTIGSGEVIQQNKDTNFHYEVRMTLLNAGNTPAYKVATNIHVDMLLYPLPADFKIPAFNPDSAGTNPVGPHQSVQVTAISPRIFSNDEVYDIEHGTKRALYVFGTVTYQDAFGVSHTIKICQILIRLQDGKYMAQNYGNYNEAN